MRVLIDTTYALRAPHSGTAVYLDRLQEALAAVPEVEVVPVANGRRRPPAGGGIGSVRNLLVDRLWVSAELPRLARLRGADVIHHPLPALARPCAVAQAITVHDLAFERMPRHFDRRFTLYARRAHRAAARGAGAVICVSETTANDVAELWGVARERIVVARHGPGQRLSQVELAPQHFLYVGDDEPRKNVSGLITAYTTYRDLTPQPFDLVLAGSATADGPGIRVERDPPAERLSALYGAAVALVAPSLYEGFGLSALEAMALGVPVVAADTPALREVCGEAARYGDPREPRSVAAAMAEVAESQRLQRQLRERGRERARCYSWSDSARAHADAYSLAVRRA